MAGPERAEQAPRPGQPASTEGSSFFSSSPKQKINTAAIVDVAVNAAIAHQITGANSEKPGIPKARGRAGTVLRAVEVAGIGIASTLGAAAPAHADNSAVTNVVNNRTAIVEQYDRVANLSIPTAAGDGPEPKPDPTDGDGQASAEPEVAGVATEAEAEPQPNGEPAVAGTTAEGEAETEGEEAAGAVRRARVELQWRPQPSIYSNEQEQQTFESERDFVTEMVAGYFDTVDLINDPRLTEAFDPFQIHNEYSTLSFANGPGGVPAPRWADRLTTILIPSYRWHEASDTGQRFRITDLNIVAGPPPYSAVIFGLGLRADAMKQDFNSVDSIDPILALYVSLDQWQRYKAMVDDERFNNPVPGTGEGYNGQVYQDLYANPREKVFALAESYGKAVDLYREYKPRLAELGIKDSEYWNGLLADRQRAKDDIAWRAIINRRFSLRVPAQDLVESAGK